MGFDGAAAYDRFMGRYSEPLAAEFAALVGVRAGQRVLDVGCGPGALTAVLVRQLGAPAVSAVDPSEAFVAAAQARLPGVEVQRSAAEHLPFEDDEFDVAVAQLVVHFMADPVAGLAEMARVTHAGGLVAACVWDYGGGGAPLAAFWRAVRALDPQAQGESGLAGAREGHLAQLFDQAGLRDVQAGMATIRVGIASFEDWWEPFTLGVGPAGDYVKQLDPQRRDELRAQCAKELPPAPFEITASAWTALGQVPG
jgi:SAM-dependent methyltransferase